MTTAAPHGCPAGKGGDPAALGDRLGLPRPRATWSQVDHDAPEESLVHRLLPAPWINGAGPHQGNWLTFRDDLLRAHHERLCAVCGLPVDGPLVYLRYAWERREAAGEKFTSGPGTHPVCAVVALRNCPHLTRQTDRGATVVAYLWDRPGQGYDDPWEELPEDKVRQYWPGGQPGWMPKPGQPGVLHRLAWERLHEDALQLRDDAVPLSVSDLMGLARRSHAADAPGKCPAHQLS